MEKVFFCFKYFSIQSYCLEFYNIKKKKLDITGYKRIAALCFETRRGVVEDTYCNLKEKPEDIIEQCNVIDCETL